MVKIKWLLLVCNEYGQLGHDYTSCDRLFSTPDSGIHDVRIYSPDVRGVSQPVPNLNSQHPPTPTAPFNPTTHDQWAASSSQSPTIVDTLRKINYLLLPPTYQPNPHPQTVLSLTEDMPLIINLLHVLLKQLSTSPSNLLPLLPPQPSPPSHTLCKSQVDTERGGESVTTKNLPNYVRPVLID
ncbi:hypothetical protein NE237_015254 [Protea cynaroides]|uniref:Uncharacterized protein n=1 Tax=Protea cynaroides TaxID=273540 RepID=A0A9Q0KDG9_9MAGN|nr:hypothetical protein NE237_015254 [Protea cynaroides]